jgi:hypothetical protein
MFWQSLSGVFLLCQTVKAVFTRTTSSHMITDTWFHFTLVVMEVFTWCKWLESQWVAVKSEVVWCKFAWEVMRVFTWETESHGFSCTGSRSWAVDTTRIVMQCQWIQTYSFWKWKGTKLFGTHRVWSKKTEIKRRMFEPLYAEVWLRDMKINVLKKRKE